MAYAACQRITRAAVDMQGLSRDERGIVSREHGHGAGDVLGGGEPVQAAWRR